MSDWSSLKQAKVYLQHLHRESVVKNSFKPLWNKCEATDPYNIAGIICSEGVLKIIKRIIRNKYNEKCDDEIILAALHKIVTDKMDVGLMKAFKAGRSKGHKNKKPQLEILKEIVVADSTVQL